MDDLTDDEILAEAIADVAFDVLSRIGNDSDALYEFFRRFIELARLVADLATDQARSAYFRQ